MNVIKYICYFTLIVFISCDAIKQVELYETVQNNSDPFLSFENKHIFIDSQKSGVWGVKKNDCKDISFDSINNHVGSDHLHIKWDGDKNCKYLGFGFSWGNFKGKNLIPLINSTAFECMIRVDTGSISKLPLFFSLLDYSEKQCFGKINILGIENGEITQKWTKVTIPLSTFPYWKKGVNMGNIKELRIELQRSGNIHIDDIKLVPHNHNYKIEDSDFTKIFNAHPIVIGNEKKYWWGVIESICGNFKFNPNPSINNIQNISHSIYVDYNKENIDSKWNNFGFPFNKWEYGDLSNLYTSSAIYFKIKAKQTPKIKLTLSSYAGEKKRIQKTINEKNVVNIEQGIYGVYIPIKSFKDYGMLNWKKLKELRFTVLETSKFEIGDFKIIEFRGNPQDPTKWKGI